jgi:hypothetical protein
LWNNLTIQRDFPSVANDHDNEAARLHQYVAEMLHNEIERFWKRSLFFWGFIAAAFVAYAYIESRDHPNEIILLAITCFGLVCSVAWTLANRGSKYWQWAWEQKLKSVEEAALGRGIFKEDIPSRNRDLWGEWRFSVSRLTIALSDFTSLVWLFLLYKSSPLTTDGAAWDTTSEAVLGITLAYLIALFIGGRTRTRG